MRGAAARSGKTITDLQVLDLLHTTGPTMAGNLADLTGLITGAPTGLLNRLWAVGGSKRIAEVTLTPAIPWWIAVQGGAAEVTAQLAVSGSPGSQSRGDSG